MAKRKLNAKGKSQKRRRASLENSGDAGDGQEEGEDLSPPSPAQHLPLDILSEIFLRAVPSGHERQIKAATLAQWRVFFSNIFPVNLTIVCRSWRNAAINTPGIWSSWFMEVHSPSQKALAIMRRFLTCILGRSIGLNITCHLRFSGTFDTLRAYDAISPLLKHQERWEDVAIDLGEANQVDGFFRLDLSQLASLRRLALTGSQWKAIGVGADGPDHRDNHLASLIPHMHTMQLNGVETRTFYRLVGAAQNLTELSCFLARDFQTIQRLSLPMLRKFVMGRTWYLAPTRFIAMLRTLDCKVLEELTIRNLELSDHLLRECGTFVTRNGLASTLVALHLQGGSYVNEVHYFEQDLLNLLGQLSMLRSLTVRAGAGEHFLNGMAQIREGRLQICPLLEDLVLEYARAKESLYSELAVVRWRTPGRCIRSMTFTVCEIVPRRGRRREELLEIPEAEDCIKEGLKLKFVQEHPSSEVRFG